MEYLEAGTIPTAINNGVPVAIGVNPWAGAITTLALWGIGEYLQEAIKKTERDAKNLLVRRLKNTGNGERKEQPTVPWFNNFLEKLPDDTPPDFIGLHVYPVEIGEYVLTKEEINQSINRQVKELQLAWVLKYAIAPSNSDPIGGLGPDPDIFLTLKNNPPADWTSISVMTKKGLRKVPPVYITEFGNANPEGLLTYDRVYGFKETLLHTMGDLNNQRFVATIPYSGPNTLSFCETLVNLSDYPVEIATTQGIKEPEYLCGATNWEKDPENQSLPDPDPSWFNINSSFESLRNRFFTAVNRATYRYYYITIEEVELEIDFPLIPKKRSALFYAIEDQEYTGFHDFFDYVQNKIEKVESPDTEQYDWVCTPGRSCQRELVDYKSVMPFKECQAIPGLEVPFPQPQGISAPTLCYDAEEKQMRRLQLVNEYRLVEHGKNDAQARDFLIPIVDNFIANPNIHLWLFYKPQGVESKFESIGISAPISRLVSATLGKPFITEQKMNQNIIGCQQYNSIGHWIYQNMLDQPCTDNGSVLPKRTISLFSEDPWIPNNTQTEAVADPLQLASNLVLHVNGSGWRELKMSFDSARARQSLLGPYIGLDVQLKELSSNPGWKGDVQLFMTIPQLNIHNRWMGRQDLNALASGQWMRLSWVIDPWIFEQMQNTFNSVEFVFALNSPYEIYFDKMDVHSSPPQPIAPNADNRTILGFESIAAWTCSNCSAIELQEQNKTEGEYSLEIQANGWTEMQSKPFIVNSASVIAVDVFLPTGGNAWWSGTISGSLNCPSLNIHSAWLGQAELTNLEKGTWQTIQLSLPQAVHSLASPTTCNLLLQVNPSEAGLTYGFDNLILYGGSL